ncbi:hypothetical protein [Hydrogenimonas sp.]
MDYISKKPSNQLEILGDLEDAIFKLHAVSMLDLSGVSDEVSIGHFKVIQSIIKQLETVYKSIEAATSGEVADD